MGATPTFASAPRQAPPVDHDRRQTRYEAVGTHTAAALVWAYSPAAAAMLYSKAFRPAVGTVVLVREASRPDRAAAFRVGPRSLEAES